MSAAARVARRLRHRGAEVRYLGVGCVVVAMCVTFACLRSDFASRANLVNLLASSAVLALIALGLTFVMIAGRFDLSGGATLALCGFAYVALYDLGIPAPVGLVLATVVGAVITGAISGVLVGRLSVSFLVVTLGVVALEQGVVELVSGGQAHAISSEFTDALAFDDVAGVPVLILAIGLTYLAGAALLRWSLFGRDVYAVGGNALAARLAGVDVARTIILVYALAGATAGLAGVVQTARIGAASAAVGNTVVFDATAAVLLGGAALSGGVGSVGGTATGVLFLAVLQNGLTLTGLPGYWQQIATGLILIVSVVANERTGRRPPM